MKVLPYPETRQVYNFDCGANAMVSVLVYAGVREREDRVAILACTTKDGTNTTDVIHVLACQGSRPVGPLLATGRLTNTTALPTLL